MRGQDGFKLNIPCTDRRTDKVVLTSVVRSFIPGTKFWFGSCRWLVPHRSLSDPILFFGCFDLLLQHKSSFFDPFEQPFSEA